MRPRPTPMTMKQLDRLLFEQGNQCFFCRKPLKPIDASVEHLVASANGGTNGEENCVACCKKLNALLGSKSLKEKVQIVLNQRGSFRCPEDVERERLASVAKAMAPVAITPRSRRLLLPRRPSQSRNRRHRRSSSRSRSRCRRSSFLRWLPRRRRLYQSPPAPPDYPRSPSRLRRRHRSPARCHLSDVQEQVQVSDQRCRLPVSTLRYRVSLLNRRALCATHGDEPRRIPRSC